MNTHIIDKRSKLTVGGEQRTLSAETIERLKKIPKATCQASGCGSKKSYLNPMLKCDVCKKKFCFDHIWRGLFNKSMKITDELRNVCDGCKKEHEYEEI